MIRKMLVIVLIAGGFLLILGAAGESDMHEQMGQYLPIMVTVKKVGLGIALLLVGVIIRRDK